MALYSSWAMLSKKVQSRKGSEGELEHLQSACKTEGCRCTEGRHGAWERSAWGQNKATVVTRQMAIDDNTEFISPSCKIPIRGISARDENMT